MNDRSPYDRGLALLLEALYDLALAEPRLLIGHNKDVLERLNTLRAREGFRAITDSTLRLTYLPQLEGFAMQGKHGPLYLPLTPELLQQLRQQLGSRD